jgi:hypothetical protein
VPSLPFWVVGVAGVFLAAAEPRRATLRRALLVLAGLAAGLMLVATSVGPEVSEHIARPYAEHLIPRFAAGDLAVSRQSFDMIQPAPGAPKQAWNLGQRLGLTGLASLLPLAMVWAACLAWLRCAVGRPRARRDSHA